MFGQHTRPLTAPRLAIVAAALALTVTTSSADDAHHVKYRLENWRAEHFESEAAAQKNAKYVRKTFNCEVEVRAHAGHFDVKYRCLKWKMLSLGSDKEALDVRAWLEKRGFEADQEP